jgi:hypothetical protein
LVTIASDPDDALMDFMALNGGDAGAHAATSEEVGHD